MRFYLKFRSIHYTKISGFIFPIYFFLKFKYRFFQTRNVFFLVYRIYVMHVIWYFYFFFLEILRLPHDNYAFRKNIAMLNNDIGFRNQWTYIVDLQVWVRHVLVVMQVLSSALSLALSHSLSLALSLYLSHS